jgi:hypothetical protein
MLVLGTLVHGEGGRCKERVLEKERDLRSKENQREGYIDTRG